MSINGYTKLVYLKTFCIYSSFIYEVSLPILCYTFLKLLADLYIYKPFFFVCDIQTLQNTQKSTKAFDSFLRILFQLCRCRFRLIILEEKFRCKSLGTGVERDLFRTQLSAYKQNMKECKSLHLKV